LADADPEHSIIAAITNALIFISDSRHGP
jgi:hypothetical protein